MHIGTHFFAGWLVATTGKSLSVRERVVIAAAGVTPDLDGLGIIGEYLTRNSAHPVTWYSDYHHVLGHNIGFALLTTAAAFALARSRRTTAMLAFVSFGLHLLFDLAGSRGADGYQWPLPVLWPFSSKWQLVWSGQWQLSAWPNTAITVVLVVTTVVLAWRQGYSPLAVISRKADAAFVAALRARFGNPG